MKARLVTHDEEDFGEIEVPGDDRATVPMLIKHRHKHFVFDGIDAGHADNTPEGVEPEGPVAHYAELPGTFYDHDAARGVR